MPRLSARSTWISSRALLTSPVTQYRAFSSTSPSWKEAKEVYFVAASRTPTAAFNGSFASVSAPKLGSHAIRSVLEKAPVTASHITNVYMGHVLQAKSGQAPARQAAIGAGLSTSVEATTINKVCASGLKAVTLAAQGIALGEAKAMVAGGMENMTQVPYYLPRASLQPAFGDTKLVDGLIADGLWDVYNQIHMGLCAESSAKKHGVTRQSQDGYAIRSYKRAQAAWEAGLFTDEIVPVTVTDRRGKDTIVKEDEGYKSLKEDKVPTLKPAFDRSGSGTVTAANSSTFNDGASALILADADLARQSAAESPHTRRVLSRLVAFADAAVDPIDFPLAPSKVVDILLSRARLAPSDISVWEFNEAFAAVVRANSIILKLPDSELDPLDGSKSSNSGVDAVVNPRGGAISLGHALGSSGSRILVTLLHTLKVGQFGVAAICNGGGGATGVVVQRIDQSEIC